MVDPALARANRLLARLPDRVVAALLGDAELIEFSARALVARQGVRVSRVLFPLSGMLSMVTLEAGGSAVEVGTIGREGMVGIEALFGASPLPFEMMWQLPGRAVAVDIDEARALFAKEPAFAALAGRFLGVLLAQVGQNAGCNRMHDLDQRAAKWLLLCRDRVDGDTFELTQEFLAIMLGVTRPKLSQVQATFQRAGFIAYTRGRLSIVDRGALEEQSCPCYAIITEQIALLERSD